MAVSLRKANWFLKLFAWRYIPLIGFCSPKIIQMNEKTVEITMPHTWRTKNHLGSIYFGALAIGADLAGAFLVFSKAKARFVIGDHPRLQALKELNIGKAIATVFLPSIGGVLDDHIESWFLDFEQLPKVAPEGFESVINLTLSEAWLPPPTAPIPPDTGDQQ